MIRTRPVVGMSWDLTRRTFISGTPQTVLRNRLTTNIAALQLQHELEYRPEDSESVGGRADVSFLPLSLRVRLAASYTPKRLRDIEGEIEYVESDSYSISTIATHTLSPSATSFGVRASRLFDWMAIGLTFATTGSAQYSLGALATFSLVRDPRDGSARIFRGAQIQQGAVSALVFLDANGNGRADSGEKPLPKMELRVDQRAEYLTGEDGIAIIPELRPYWPVDVSVAATGADNPFLRATVPGVRVVPRPGKVARVDVPFILAGQMDGYVTRVSGAKEKPARGVPLELVAADGSVATKAKSESDGFYSFDTVPPGAYRVRVHAAWLLERGLVSQPLVRESLMPPQGAFVSDLAFRLVSSR